MQTESALETQTPRAQSLARVLFGGISTLGTATLLERGLGFLANLAAARVGGVHLFGAYSLALTTATNVASYAGAGIGTTANRFSGEYPYGRPGYRALLRALSLVSAASAAIAALVLWLAAEPLAKHLLLNSHFTPLLRLAGVSAGAVILLECLRGFLIGQRKFAALMCLCFLSGGGLLIVLPAAARHGAAWMIAGQAAVTAGAIALCVMWARKLEFAPEPGGSPQAEGPRPGEIVRFGAVQLLSTMGINAAGWWVASLVARADLSLVQMGFYSVALQLRNICGMAPLLVSQTGYALMTDAGGKEYGGADRVTISCTVAASTVSLLIGGAAVALIPWVLPMVYGESFAGAEFTATLAVATGIVHMSAAPAAARLTVVSLPLTAVINGIWTLVVISLGTWLTSPLGAAGAAATMLAAHLLSAVLVACWLVWAHAAPRKLLFVTMQAIVASALLATLGWMRSISVSRTFELSAAMIAVMVLFVWVGYYLGGRPGSLPVGPQPCESSHA